MFEIKAIIRPQRLETVRKSSPLAAAAPKDSGRHK